MRHSANNPKILENRAWRLSRRPLLSRRASLRAPAVERSTAKTPGGFSKIFDEWFFDEFSADFPLVDLWPKPKPN